MLHLRTDWQGVQDLRHVLPRLNDVEATLYHAFSERGLDPAPLSQFSFAIDEIARQAGVSPHDIANRLFPTGSTIQPDEPIFLVRAKDPCSVPAALAWAGAAATMGCDRVLFERVLRWADEMRAWQQQHNPTPHSPDAPELLP